MEMSPVAAEILALGLRSRAETRADLAQASGKPLEDVNIIIDQLAAAGFLTEASGLITYRRPDVTAAELTSAVLQGFSADIERAIDSARHTLGALPGLLQAWEMGMADMTSLRMDILHGPWAPADMWRLQYSRGIPLVTDACMPDTTAMAAIKVEHQASFWQARAGHPLTVRLLMSVADATSPHLQERIASELAAGVQIRMHPDPPSWFWITDHDTVGMPLNWGEAWPHSVMALQSPALAHMLTWVFERVWNQAVPVGGTEHPWQSLLMLMNRGMTMEAAAHALGIAPRTARRRVADAMEHYGTTSLFSLGAAWGQDPSH